MCVRACVRVCVFVYARARKRVWGYVYNEIKSLIWHISTVFKYSQKYSMTPTVCLETDSDYSLRLRANVTCYCSFWIWKAPSLPNRCTQDSGRYSLICQESNQSYRYGLISWWAKRGQRLIEGVNSRFVSVGRAAVRLRRWWRVTLTGIRTRSLISLHWDGPAYNTTTLPSGRRLRRMVLQQHDLGDVLLSTRQWHSWHFTPPVFHRGLHFTPNTKDDLVWGHQSFFLDADL